MNIKEKDIGKFAESSSAGMSFSAESPLKQKVSAGLMLKGSLAGLFVFALAFVFLPYIVGKANAESVGGQVDWGAMSITLDPDYGNGSVSDEGHGDVEFGLLSPTSAGVAKVVKKTIGVSTSENAKYYAVYLSINGQNTNPAYTTNDLAYVNNNESITSINIPAVTGTYDAPVAFSNSTHNNGAWGYASPDFTTALGKTGTAWAAKAVYEGNTTDVFDPANPSGGTPTWSKVPLQSRATGNVQYADLIYKANTNSAGFGTESGQDTNNHFDVYYGVMVNDNVLSGSYKNEVVYTAVASAQSMDSVSENLISGKYFGGDGDEVEIRFDLTESVASLQQGDVHVYLVPHSVLSATGGSNYSLSGLNRTDYQEVTVTDFYSKVTGDTSSAQPGVTLTVEMPSRLDAGKKDATNTTVVAGTNDALVGGDGFDFWVYVDGYNFNYISHKTDSGTEIAAFTYVGLQTINPVTSKPYVTDMQNISGGVCKLSNRWNNHLGGAALITGKARTGSYADLGTGSTTNSLKTVVQATMTGTNSNAGTFELRDSRDGKLYAVRRLADGECWMVQNLDLELDNTTVLSAVDTDLKEGRSTWSLEYADLQKNANKEHGSTSAAWKKAHGIESVTLTKGTWVPTHMEGEGEEEQEVAGHWEEMVVEACGVNASTNYPDADTLDHAGTDKEPCFINAGNSNAAATIGGGEAGDGTNLGSEFYFYSDEGVWTRLTQQLAHDEYGEENKTGAEEQAYMHNDGIYHEFVFDVMYAKQDTTSGLYTYVDASRGETLYGDGSCRMYVDRTGRLLGEYGYCAVTTTGNPMVLQMIRFGTMSGAAFTASGVYTDMQYGMSSNWNHDAPKISSVLGYTPNGGTAQTPSVPVDANGDSLLGSGLVSSGRTGGGNRSAGDVETGTTSAVDWGWAGDTGDGAHIYDHGPVKMAFTSMGGQTSVDNYPDYSGKTRADLNFGAVAGYASTVCANSAIVTGDGTGSTRGGVAIESTTCTDGSGNPIADTNMVGNWYNFYAATAGDVNASASSGQAESSICPKGWQLPSDISGGAATADSGSKGFSHLLIDAENGYGLDGGTYGLTGDNSMFGQTISGSNIDSVVMDAPLSFIRSGNYNWATGYLGGRRSYGYYWSSRVYSAASSRYLAFYSAAVYPWNLNNKGYGFAVRCVARG